MHVEWNRDTRVCVYAVSYPSLSTHEVRRWDIPRLDNLPNHALLVVRRRLAIRNMWVAHWPVAPTHEVMRNAGYKRDAVDKAVDIRKKAERVIYFPNCYSTCLYYGFD